jgi:endonuclease/exonuclease/phosphatase family metal-dependent hydrolase
MEGMIQEFRMAISNVQNGIGTTRGFWHYSLTAWKYKLPHRSAPIRAAGRFMKKEAVDLAALCEIGGGAWRTFHTDQTSLLAAEAGFEEKTFFPTLVKGRWMNQGNAVCARFPIRSIANHRLPGRGEPRYLSEAEVDIRGVRTVIFVTHLSLSRPLRDPQIEWIAERVDKLDRPTLLAGDFNISKEDEFELLLKGDLKKAPSLPTFPAWNPARPLDHLFFTEHFQVKQVQTFDRFRFSDHLPLLVDLSLSATPDS